MFRLLKNMFGAVGERLKYGHENGPFSVIDKMTMAASQNTLAGSTCFVTPDASGNGVYTSASSTWIFGHVNAPVPNTGSTTTAADNFACNVALDSVYRIKINSGTYARANRGLLCDLSIATSVQGAAVQTSTRGHLKILDGDEASNKWVIAMLNPAKVTGGNAS